MKKTIILLMSIITIILIMFIIVNNNPEPIKFQYNNIYIKETYNYINNDLYSTTIETITLKNGALDYEATITYEDKSIKPITIEYINKYEEKTNRIITKNKTYYIDSNKLCLDSIDCSNPYTIDINKVDNKIDNFKIDNYYSTKKNIEPLSTNELYVIVDKKDSITKSYKKILKNIAYDFNIKITIIELNNKNKEELSTKYNINSTPIIFLYLNGEIQDTEENITTHEDLALYLFLKGIDYR